MCFNLLSFKWSHLPLMSFLGLPQHCLYRTLKILMSRQEGKVGINGLVFTHTFFESFQVSNFAVRLRSIILQQVSLIIVAVLWCFVNSMGFKPCDYCILINIDHTSVDTLKNSKRHLSFAIINCTFWEIKV